MSMVDNGIGARVRRKEDYRFITGHGNYTDDINRANQTYAFIVRSSVAHANIKAINARATAGSSGVVAVFTSEDMAADNIGGLPCGWAVNNKDGTPMAEPPHPPLALDKVRYVGDPVAVVIAESYAAAKDAAELVEVDYEELPPVVSVSTALQQDAPQLFEEAPGNVCFDWEFGDRAATEQAFANATHVTKIDLVNDRLIANAMEPRAAIGEFNAATGKYTLHTTTQNPHVIRLLMGTNVLRIPEHKLRVVSPDVGGGFGSKVDHYGEEAIVTWASAKIGRPVKWTAERSESFMSDTQGRDHQTHAELAMDAQGKFLGLKVSTIANLGSYLATFGPAIPTFSYATVLAGVYATPAIYCEVKAVFTNTVPVDAYRGAGRPEATYMLERLADLAAHQLGIDPIELRRRNLIPRESFPYQTPVMIKYDNGDYEATLDAALELADYAGFDERRDAAAATGKLRGIGVSVYMEACGVAPSAFVGKLGARAGMYEVGVVRVHPTGSVTVLTGTHTHGQGHETTFAQLITEYLGVAIENVDIVHGDSDRIPFGLGTFGSRSIAVGGGAIFLALGKIIDKGKKIAAHLMEVAADDVEFANGQFRVVGTKKTVAFNDVALAAYVPHNYPLDELEPGLEETAYYDPSNFTFPAGCHIGEVEIDPETGVVTVVNYTVADDFGRVINPMIVEGQVHGGIAQGIGQALMEQCVYDPDTGQLLSGSFLDYCMPRADDLPSFKVTTKVTPSTDNPLGVKGCGEAGTIGAPPAIINAVLNALRPFGIMDIAMPATPHRVWQAINAAGARSRDHRVANP
jgi:carbon-monoxide dehydrogenase large subunit